MSACPVLRLQAHSKGITRRGLSIVPEEQRAMSKRRKESVVQCQNCDRRVWSKFEACDKCGLGMCYACLTRVDLVFLACPACLRNSEL